MSYQNLKEFYLTKEEVEKALAAYNAGRPDEEHLFYIPYYEEWNNRRVYIPCEREYFYFWRNERRKERLQQIREGRCKVPSEKYGVKRCTADCKHCPYKQDPNDPDKEVTDYNWTGNALSLDEPVGFHDDGDPIYIEVADESASILEAIIEEEMKAEGTTYASKKEFKEELARRVSARSEEQINSVAEQIKATGEIDVHGRKLPNQHIAEIANTNIDEYIDDVRSHIINPEGLDFYKNRATLLMENEDYLKTVFSNLPENNLEDYLKAEMKDAPENVKVIFEEILAHKPELMESRCARTLERIERIKDACGEGGFTPEKYLAKMQSDNQLVEDLVSQLEEAKIKDVANSDGNVIKQTLEKLKQICTYDEGANKQLHDIFHDTETMQKSAGKISEKIYKDMAKGYKKFIEGGYKGFSQVAKVLTGVFITLPITCTALNLIYPRFMEIFFPKLAGVKKEGGNK